MTEWKKVKLGDVGNTYAGLSGKAKEDFGHGKAKYIPYINIFNNIFVDVSALEDIEVDEKQNCVKKGDVFFTTSSETPEEVGMSSVLLQDVEDTYLNSFCFGYRPEKIFDSVFLAFMLRSDSVRKQFRILAQGISRFNISKTKVMEDIFIFVPPIEEQQKIAEILSAQDKLIELKQKLIDNKKLQKKWLMQNLLTGKIRLKGFSGKWEKYEFNNLFDTISSKKHQITTKEYQKRGKYPVVDQGKKLIIGYSDLIEKVLLCPDEGIILFGDHTREIKYITFDFIVGADGTQLLKTNNNFTNTCFMYYYLSSLEIPNNGYSRHFKYIKSIIYKIPDLSEQIAIAEILSAQDKEIELLEKQLEQEKLKKKALMQLLLTGKIRVV